MASALNSRRAKLRVLASIRPALAMVLAADRRGTIFNAAGQLLGAVATLAIVLLTKEQLGRLLSSEGRSAFATLWPLFLLSAVAGFVAAFTAIAAQHERLMGERVQQYIWTRVLDAVARVDLVTYESDGFTTQLASIERNALTRPLPTVRALSAFVGAALICLVLIAALFAVHPLLPPVLLIAAVPTILVGRRTSRLEYHFVEQETTMFLRREYLRTVLSRRTYAAEVRAFNMGATLRPRFHEMDRGFAGRLKTHVRARQRLSAISSAASITSIVAMLAVVTLLVDHGTITLTEAGTAAVIARLLASALTRAYNSISTLAEGAPQINDLAQFLAAERRPRPPGTTRRLLRSVELRGVRFTYPQGSRPAVDDVTMTIRAGEVVALVGENGSGKSTLARIVSGLFEPDDGVVLWDGEPSLARDRLASLSLLSQGFGRYAFSARDNITLGAPDDGTVDERMQHAAQQSRFAEIARGLPAAYDTILGRELDEGVDLSGGQWQRLALARALYRAGDLIVLDEPSAALDPRAESELFDDVRHILLGRAALLISHRFSSVRLADRIYVLHDGCVVEEGTHESLVQQNGRYAELFRLQSAAYLDSSAQGRHRDE